MTRHARQLPGAADGLHAARPAARLRRAGAAAGGRWRRSAAASLALATFREDKQLPVATVRLSVQLNEPGALGIYVPLVDWGVRFGAVRLPVQLRVDVRRVDRAAAERIARNRSVDLSRCARPRPTRSATT